ncbi:MAG TPA: MCE family protein [Actinomycetota bacterium]|nr:MCE family protein [Actinomycetota bacterium]
MALQRWIRPLTTVVIVLLIAGGAGLLYTSRASKDDSYHITAYFTKTIGLFENSDVDILGVPVGKVTNVDPEGTQVRVDMEIDSQYKIEKSASTFAQIVPISVISDRYIQLGPTYDDSGTYLRDGDVLSTEVTQIPAELDDVFKQLKKLLDAIQPGKNGQPGALGDLIVQLNKTLKDRERDLQGTLITGANLTGTLAGARNDLSGLLVHLDGLFRRLASRAGSIGELNKNFALVMTALAQSRSDLQGTIKNVADMTHEVGDLVTDRGDRLGNDLALATKITSSVLRNRASVEESLSWLPVVGKGAGNAFHGGPNKDVDVRDNATAKLQCALLDNLPPGPIKDQLKEICQDQTGEPPRTVEAPAPSPTTPTKPLLDCDKAVRKVKHQLRRIERLGLPDDALHEIVDPLKKQMRALKKACKKVGGSVDVNDILDQLPDLPPIPDLPNLPNAPDEVGVGSLTGNAAGTNAAPTEDDSAWDGFTGWLGDFVSFLGVGR